MPTLVEPSMRLFATILLFQFGCGSSTQIQDVPVNRPASTSDSRDESKKAEKQGETKRPATPMDELELRAKRSSCKFFDSEETDLPFSDPIPPFAGTRPLPGEPSNPKLIPRLTNILQMPPVVFPMPIYRTFHESGYYEGDDFNFIAMVDILISYNPKATIWRDNYDGMFQRVLPGDPESPLHERRVYEVTIQNADDKNCTSSWKQVE